MAERDTIVDKQRLTYEGLFDAKELYRLMDDYFEDRNYDKREIRNIEVVKEEGKFIDIEIEPWKKYTDYYRNIIHIRIIMSDLKEVEVERHKTKIKVNQGKLQMVFDGYIETDYKDKWESKPMFFFIRTIFDKYIYKPFTLSYAGSVKRDVDTLITQIKAFLNVYRAY